MKWETKRKRSLKLLERLGAARDKAFQLQMPKTMIAINKAIDALMEERDKYVWATDPNRKKK